MIKVSRTNLRVLVLVLLFASACSFAIGFSTAVMHLSQDLYRTNSHHTSLLPNTLFQSGKTTQQPDNNAANSENNFATEGENTSAAEGDRQTESQPQIHIFAPPIEFQGKTIKEVKTAEDNKVIALTFDDGPWPKYTQEILEILKKEKIKATFFWIGKNVKNFPEIAKQVVAEGHEIGNHTWSHSYRMMSKAVAAREIDDTAAIVEETTGVKTTLFRPPGGLLKNGPAAYALSKNYVTLMWSADSTDYAKGVSVNTLINRALKNSRPGGMVLMHDGGGDRTKTVKALPQIIADLKKQGYKFVTVTELLEIGDQKEISPPKAKPGNLEIPSQSDPQLGENNQEQSPKKESTETEIPPLIDHQNP